MHTAMDSPKPDNSTWTDDQWDAIVTSGSNILVAAAAGSGKTAVLVERIIRKISAHADVDRLLVATFTKAAAAEMKDRIRLALEKELERQPDSEHLRRQLALMNRASITTLHSFCLDVIRRYYPLIGLDPGFRIANETESELMRLDVLDQLFEQKYEGAGDEGAFLRLADRYGGERGDEPLYRLVQQLYDFSQSHPWPEHWLRETANAFGIDNVEQLQSSDWVKSLQMDIQLALEGAASLLRQALELTRQPSGPAPYEASFDEDLQLVNGLSEMVHTSPWETWIGPFQSIQFGKLKAMRGDEYDKSLQEQAKELRDSAKKWITTLADELFGRTAEQFLEELQELAPLMKALAELVVEFGQGYEAAKRAKGLLDFGDLEHYCLRILRDPSSTPGGLIPSVAALEFQQQFDEILLDEYQDTNMVQEAIVSLIERPGAGNRFMVGDVKQSIYRFRLAEPKLFLQKYKSYLSRQDTAGQAEDIFANGLRIDLARNFRSRSEVVDGVNAVFRSIMRENVAEMNYDKRAELVCGASYPIPVPAESCQVEFAVLNKADADEGDEEGSEDADLTEQNEDGQLTENSSAAESAAELKTAQLEARWVAQQLRSLIDRGYQVYDAKRRESRPLQWRDVVILLRATQQWAPIIIEELQSNGIPAYAELSSGYFDAVEVETMLSLLRIIDNPYQDIPLAAALRSPLFALDAEDLARIRILSAKASYYDAVLHAAGDLFMAEESRGKLSLFLESLDRWRNEARQGSLANLIWEIYRETGYYDFVGGLPGGTQRQANLRALHDRARQYESTSFRGLFRFLRFIERMRESGGDLGTARALGEQEDVVRIMSIHKSKGLEFPVVFVAGLGKLFNQQDIRSAFLKHKQLGFGPLFVDPSLRISYPTLPYLSIRRAMRMEMLAEEMRILYVALTRPKEKMFLVGTVSDAVKKLKRWLSSIDAHGRLPDFRVASARSFIDWLGPLAARQMAERERLTDVTSNGPQWEAGIVPASLFGIDAAAALEKADQPDSDMQERLQAVTSLSLLENTEQDEELRTRLEWQYRYHTAASLAAKTSVTEMKRLHAEPPEDAIPLEELRGQKEPGLYKTGQTEPSPCGYTFRLRRPAFMEEVSLTPAEKGSVNHLLMQHVSLAEAPDEEKLKQTIDRMIERRILTVKQSQVIDLGAVAAFFRSELGQRMLSADWVRREVPFSCMFPANRVYPQSDVTLAAEPILIQGVIDCLFEDKKGIVLLDYKTDRIMMNQWEAAAERHRFQLELYAEAVESVLKRKIDESHVFFFDGGQSVQLNKSNSSKEGG
ncbi:helicase-exonuclease AddAB subunit AddA [Paenibacillus alkaliterrae]|uniref:helicase-exonuclease AddAB subunit AddA n=1 Tax=Paenibacillus alkaliterrae TaxID=320909 RepID=UPI001F3606D3|nr:helicase-exonuclease AddAB subunit AddA [Paenibacillus alkaliterrae]MCF2940806.1 helicase-exonuclease AddAB subunit AddA [Paenibacillus alkaliterrae]